MVRKEKEKIAMESLYELEKGRNGSVFKNNGMLENQKDKAILTSFSRTIPMLEIYKFMEEIEKIKLERDIKITDITEYNSSKI